MIETNGEQSLIGKKLDEYPAEEETVLLLLERVGEAQRLATMALREEESNRKQRKGRHADADAGDEGAAAPHKFGNGGPKKFGSSKKSGSKKFGRNQ